MEQPPLDPRLARDTHALCQSAAGRVLLHRNATVPWLILVPDTEVRRLHELDPRLRGRVSGEMDRLSQYVMRAFECEHVNVAAIGNIVEQLHIHIIGRRHDDPLWPGVVWGRLGDGPAYTPAQVQAVAMEVESTLKHE